MSITKQLHVRFGALLLIVLLLLFVIVAAVYRERSTKASAAQAQEMSDLTDSIRSQMMQNRLYLGNYLLSGDTREIEHMNEGIRLLNESLTKSEKLASSDQQRSALENVAKNETSWTTDFAQPMLQKRREVDAGNATVADLQIYYLQKDASSWVKTSTDFLNQADQETKNLVDKRRKSDDDAGTEIILIASLSTLVALGLGTFIAYKTAKSLTDPLNNL